MVEIRLEKHYGLAKELMSTSHVVPAQGSRLGMGFMTKVGGIAEL
jgi:hypothetical protein